MCSDPLDPGGEVRDCSVGCTLGMSDVSPFRAAAALDVHTEFPELKNAFSRGVAGFRAIFAAVGHEKSLFSGVLIGPKSLNRFTPLHEILKFMPHTAARCCNKHQQQKTPRAQQNTSSLLIPCAHGKLNVKPHRTTSKPDIHITIEKEAALARK